MRMTSKVSIIKSDGRRLADVPADVQPRMIFFDNGQLPIEEGDRIERELPNGLVETFEIVERGFWPRPGRRGHYQSKVRKLTAGRSPTAETHSTIYNLTAPNARININSNDSSTNVISLGSPQLFEQLRQQIMTQDAADRERNELISRVEGLEAAVSTPNYVKRY